MKFVPGGASLRLANSTSQRLVLLVSSAALVAATPPIVIQNATILTVTKGTLNGSVLIRDGKIAEVGEKVTVPADAKVIDASGQFVMPGIIDCHSHIAADSINEGSVSVSSMVGIEDVLNPDDIAIYRAVAGGVTTANILHGSANSIGGKCTVIKLRWGKDAHDMIFQGALPGIKFALGENPKRAGNPTGQRIGAGNVQGRYPATRMGVEDVIREAFTQAKAYQQSWKDYNEKVARGEQAVAPRRDLKLEPLVEVLEGKRLVHSHCYRADEILMLLRVADDYGFKIRTLQHVLEGYKVAKEIAAHGAGASTFSDWWAYKMEAFDAIPYNAAIMVRKGVLVSLNSDSDELMRHLNDEAAKTMKYGGLTETEALSLVTINPAKQLMIDNKVGSIEVGKDADIAIFDKHPLSNYAKVEKVFIDGQLYFDRASDLAERTERETEKKKLMDKEKEEQKKNAPAGRGRPAA
jgi:imidazolonepropionase-like amidohydrolase